MVTQNRDRMELGLSIICGECVTVNRVIFSGCDFGGIFLYSCGVFAEVGEVFRGGWEEGGYELGLGLGCGIVCVECDYFLEWVLSLSLSPSVLGLLLIDLGSL